MTDLQKFASTFDATYMRWLPHGLEVRVSNLEAGKHDAERLIRDKGWKLVVTTEGSMYRVKAFLVKEVGNG